MELIDRGELLSGIRPVSEFDEKWACTGSTVKKLMIEHISRAPTVDAVPVVRCGECRYSSFVKSISKFMCEKCNGFMRYSDDYCSYGERKTDAR